jgi:hypothetical protein
MVQTGKKTVVMIGIDCHCHYVLGLPAMTHIQTGSFCLLYSDENSSKYSDWQQLSIFRRQQIFRLATVVTIQTENFCTYTVVKARGIFLFPRIFQSYFMKILQQIFRKNVLRSISWNFSKSNSNFSELPHSMIYDERFRDFLGRLSAELVLPFLFQKL